MTTAGIEVIELLHQRRQALASYRWHLCRQPALITAKAKPGIRLQLAQADLQTGSHILDTVGISRIRDIPHGVQISQRSDDTHTYTFLMNFTIRTNSQWVQW